MRRVVVTGVGAITSLGFDARTTWQKLLEGKSGIKRIENFDVSDLSVQIAAEITNFNPEKRIPFKLIKRIDRCTQFALWATMEAVEDAKIDFDGIDRKRVGVIIGSGIGGLITLEREHEKFLSQGPRRVSPLLIPMMIADMPSGQVSIYYRLGGPNYCTVSACASGAHAIGDALEMIRKGAADIMITGGTEAPLTRFAIAGFAQMRALSTRNDEPEKASRPFDKERDGFVMGEGCGILILEELEHARRRKARIYCELAGYGATGDGYHMTAPDPEGDGGYRGMVMALDDAGVDSGSIDYINAHGTSTPLNDKIETLAIKKLLGERAKKVPISSTKSMIGHLLGAAGGVEAVATVLSIYEGRIHPTINLENPDPECDLDYCPEGARQLNIRAAISNSLGFGGHNATLLFRKLEG
ncbi:beta-ketoacyl-[acyl-carrier-protein] synthase II [candidate division WOR-3 bacterium]|uniref:3-oxoacyl-[acyl-carrier-protein] synthase 2 n=1 Tax=candidate division WOR-3 bacterium TaxID=2052148 RepID=A0A660SJU8_UNCW3|nr:MAG: beta-ketoacyl-[acyl-carrier-protein] synthase II [candidate division WOR-3 bacterium]